MRKLKKGMCLFRDLIEIYLPTASFVVLFLAFVYSVLARYIFNKPPSWGTEVQVATYMATVLLGACYVRRLNKHVSFTMVYDILSDRGKIIMRIFRNIIMGVTYAVLLLPTIEYILKYRTISPALKIPIKIYFAPIIILVFGVMCYSFIDAYHDVKLLLGRNEMNEGNPLDISEGKEENK